MRNTRDNETELVYDMNDVEDQGENPVLTDSQDELEEEADRLASLGDPVTAFLNSDEFTSVDPSAEERSEDGPGDEESEGGSAAGLGASLCALLMAVVASVLSR
jgi:C-terminal processing protease CtpA/Prc